MRFLVSLSLPVLIFMTSYCAWAQDDTIIYKEKGNNGTPIFTDQPTPNATAEQLAPANIIDAPQPVSASDNNPPIVNTYSIEIMVTPDSQPEIGLGVSINTKPALKPGMSVDILVDGARYMSGAQTQFTLIGLNSGIRNLQAILKRGNAVLATSATIPVEVQRLGGAKKR